MDEWIIYSDTPDATYAYLVRLGRPRYVLELEVGADGTWQGRDIWALDTVTVEDVERLMREVGM